MENWKQFHNTGLWLWSVSDHGRIKKKCLTTRKDSKNFQIEKIVTTTPTGGYEGSGRYHAIPANFAGKYVHRIVANAFIPNPQNKRTVNHIDCDKNNNHVSNLEWATYSENAQHAHANGQYPDRSLPPEELARRIAERRARYREQYRAQRIELMTEQWSPYLKLPLTDLQERYVRLRMVNTKPGLISKALEIDLKQTYKLPYTLRRIRAKHSDIF